MADALGNDVSKLAWGPGKVYYGTENGTASSYLGMCGEDGYNLILKPSYKRIKSGAYLLAVGMIPEDLEVLVEGSVLESTLANLNILLSAIQCTDLAGTGAVIVRSLKLEGTTMPGGTVIRTTTLGRGMFIGDVTHAFKQGQEWVFPFQFTLLGASTVTPTIAEPA